MPFKYILSLVFFLLLSCKSFSQNKLYQVKEGMVSFFSDAPLELINASSDQLIGVIDTAKGEFAFKLSIASFDGFNNPLQKEHFNENYMETVAYPFATYVGKIIENVNYSKSGTYTVRTKGKMTIHGITQERIIKATLTITQNKINIKAEFMVLLSDYDIKIPKIVGNNLAKEIKVRVTAGLMPKN